ncbi:MAG: ATP-binding protein [Salinisphaera sp.]|uniref:ATP-binding protein n=1 Tax=Salinisphaera sp. TaxID=1914330 RepID=UPI003C7CA804
MSTGPQRVVKIRRAYNRWVGDETLEDYALRFTARSFRKWSELRIANTALGGISFLVLEAIGAVFMLRYGFVNTACAIITVCVAMFVVGLPISYTAARYGVDIDLLTRGAGFGYLGSTITSLIYASFTFLFFALEATIMGQAISLYFDITLPLAYLISALAIIPLVTFGITAINRLQWYTQPLWLALLALPYLFIAVRQPAVFSQFQHYIGEQGTGSFDWIAFGSACGIALALIGQIGEQVDYLRFLPERGPGNRLRWWAAVVGAGPGWVILGGLKMFGGALLAFLAVQHQLPHARATEPTHLYEVAFGYVFSSPGLAMTATVLFVIVSQVKINVTNAYAGSLAWSNFFARVTRSHPGRVVWLVFNVVIALILLEMGVFHAIERVLGLYANVAAAWFGALAADLLVNKPLGLSPPGIEFKRAHLYDLNPVGIGAFVLASGASLTAYSDCFGPAGRAAAPAIALGGAFVTAPLIAWLTAGRFYLARTPASAAELAGEGGNHARCVLCNNRFEVDDMAGCPAYAGAICSLCCSLDMRCADRCRPHSHASAQIDELLQRVLPRALMPHLCTRLVRYGVVLGLLAVVLVGALIAVYAQIAPLVDSTGHPHLLDIFLRTFFLMLVPVGILSWWLVLAREARNVAQHETSRQTQLLMREVAAHKRTDAKLARAKAEAESANRAKSRYVSGLSHELRTPLNNVLGYTQLLMREPDMAPAHADKLATIQRSGEHLLALVDGLLDIARIEAGRVSLHVGEIDAAALLDQIEAMFAPQAMAKGLDFCIEPSQRMPPVVRGDLQRLRQILINLIGNAIRFTQAGEVRVRVNYASEVATFEIIDTGPGIDDDKREQIFLPFERIAGGSDGGAGAGLGLTICQLLTQLMGGDLKVRSNVPAGSCFVLRVFLPHCTRRSGARPPVQRIIGYEGRKRHLLVVDDRADQRGILRAALEPLGFALNECEDGPEALHWLATERTDLILMDVALPGMDGFETARMIRERRLSDAPVLVVSANAYADNIARSRTLGCDAFLSKPINLAELFDRLAELLLLQWQRDEQDVLSDARTRAGARTKYADGALSKASDRCPLPGPLAHRLTSAIDIGHMAGVLAEIAAIEREHPEHGPRLADLRDAARRHELIRLRRLAEESRARTAQD